MDFLRNYIKGGYLKAVGSMDDYKVILGAAAYFDKGILKESDLMEINEAIQNQYINVEEVLEDIIEDEEKETKEETIE